MSKFGEIAAKLEDVLDKASPLLEGITEGKAGEPWAAGKWTRKQVICHVLDSAENNHQRFVRAAIQGELIFPGYDQEPMVELQNPNGLPWNFLVQFWMNYNRFIVFVLRQITDGRWDAICRIGENPPEMLGAIADDYIEHLKHHLNQVLGETFTTIYGKS